MTKNSDLYDSAVEAANQLFGDTSVSKTETRSRLEELIDEIRGLVDSLPEET